MYIDTNAHYFHLWSARDCKVKQLLEVLEELFAFLFFHLYTFIFSNCSL